MTKLMETLQKILDRLDKMEVELRLSKDKFAACAEGFRQTKDACEILLDRREEASGFLTSATWG